MNQRPHILVIEDDIEIRSLLRDYLARENFRVEVGDGGAALDRFRATFGEPDLVVLDIMLPGEDGLSICRRVRAASRVPILLLTAKGDDVDRIVGLEIGADECCAGANGTSATTGATRRTRRALRSRCATAAI
jgi:two-component system OmpR family response regulator